jgi:hypothetical protein
MKFFLATLALLAPLVLAEITIDAPKNPVSSGSITVNWHSDPAVDPPVFQLYLFNEVFHDNFGIANNVDRSLNSITLVLPVVPAGDGYTIKAVALDNVGNVFGSSPNFYIGETTASSTPSSTKFSTSSHASSSTQLGSTTSGSPSMTTSKSSTSGFGSTFKPSTTSTDTSGSASESAGASESSGAAALGVKKSIAASYSAFAVALVGAAIGGAVVAF